MASFKVRRLSQLAGGVTTAGVLTSSACTNLSGSTTIAGSTSACWMTISGSMRVGSNGAIFTKLLHGLVATCVPAMGASAIGTGSAFISNLAAGATVNLWITSQGASGINVLTASAVSACCASLSFFALAGATDASTMNLGYIALNP